jgi:hypothetical protein
MWNELNGTNQLVAFDESGEVRTLYATDRNGFIAGAGFWAPARSIHLHGGVKVRLHASHRVSRLRNGSKSASRTSNTKRTAAGFGGDASAAIMKAVLPL